MRMEGDSFYQLRKGDEIRGRDVTRQFGKAAT